MKYNAFSTACEIGFSGEVEDYLISIGDPVVDILAPSAPANLTASGVTQNSVNLSWTASPDNIGVTGYDVYKDGEFLATVTGTSYTAGNLSAETQYDFYVKARDAAGNVSDASNTITIKTSASSINYCSSYGNGTSEFIKSVTVGSVTNNSGNNSGYGDFTTQPISIDRSGNSITITPGWTSRTRSEAYRVWIDYNADGDFDDTGELVFSRSKTTATSVSGTFSVPSTVTGPLTTRIRVSMKYNALPSPCEVGFNGEVEDYTVSIPAVTNAEVSLKSGFTGNDVNELKMQEFTVYPNPASNLLNLSFEGFKPSSVRIFNSGGVLVLQKSVEPVMEISNLAEGFYIIELVKDNTVLARNRFIKKK